MIKDACISENGRYRHWLSRIWNERLGRVTIIGLNPSTADASEDDPTIRRCIDFVKSWGYGGFYMVNLFDYRATKPADLKKAASPMSFQNDAMIRVCARRSEIVVFAWGSFTRLMGRDMKITSQFPDGYCLGVCQNGQPRHPLFLKKTTELVPYWSSPKTCAK